MVRLNEPGMTATAGVSYETHAQLKLSYPAGRSRRYPEATACELKTMAQSNNMVPMTAGSYVSLSN